MTGREELAAAQEALVAALVAGGPVPPGFDPALVGAASRALLRKRAGEVARTWPALAASFGPRWAERFARWAEGRPPRGSWRDGWDFARAHRDTLDPAATRELALAEARWCYDGTGEPRPRRFALRRIPGAGVAVVVSGRPQTVLRRPS
ncbi:hypothetical protein [Thermomonospora cellulosilytica]|uniref:SCO6045-like C-terminal domain-containing protein n=1 Tax=Thermomonospora cellulosilytica TaxID=1411118 RepID=A0A7W3N342_9ACTN|nr:hypothetical protein [Thermomonospora cellulosilytica]MBA9006640.1 hypothetical protein [Thermomonospora cellulosilytica]